MNKLTPSPYLAREAIWAPLVLVDTHTLGLFIQPGAQPSVTKLPHGWHWHWPLLTTIRTLNLDPLPYRINARHQSKHNFGDEPVIAVTKDHHLVRVTGELTLQVDGRTSVEVLARLDRRATSRIIRPLIRQAIRSVIGQYEKDELLMHDISSKLLHACHIALTEHGIQATACDNATIAAHDPLAAATTERPTGVNHPGGAAATPVKPAG